MTRSFSYNLKFFCTTSTTFIIPAICPSFSIQYCWFRPNLYLLIIYLLTVSFCVIESLYLKQRLHVTQWRTFMFICYTVYTPSMRVKINVKLYLSNTEIRLYLVCLIQCVKSYERWHCRLKSWRLFSFYICTYSFNQFGLFYSAQGGV